MLLIYSLTTAYEQPQSIPGFPTNCTRCLCFSAGINFIIKLVDIKQIPYLFYRFRDLMVLYYSFVVFQVLCCSVPHPFVHPPVIVFTANKALEVCSTFVGCYFTDHLNMVSGLIFYVSIKGMICSSS